MKTLHIKGVGRFTLLQIAVHIAAWIPLIKLAWDYQADRLTVNPIQAAEIRTGQIALVFLLLSLTCRPLNALYKIPQVVKLDRPLGLYGYLYAAIHLLIFAGLDYAFDFSLIPQAVTEKPYIVIGLAAFILLSLLAITSFRWWMARLGKNWKRLHRLVYLINLLVVVHFAMSVKGDLLRLQGDIWRPLLAGAAVLLLLTLRLPAVRRWMAGQRRRPIPAAAGMPKRDRIIQ